MRNNLPVTGQEVLLEEGQTIVSTTDLQGNITYANPYFIRISGFTEEELIGAPQNIVRHPDMPAEAFADLWASIRAGMPWSDVCDRVLDCDGVFDEPEPCIDET